MNFAYRCAIVIMVLSSLGEHQQLQAGLKGAIGRGGGGRAAVGARPAGRSFSRPSTPSLGRSRPMPRPNVSRPTMSRPAPRPSVNRPQPRPSGGGFKGTTRPTTRNNFNSNLGSSPRFGERPGVGTRPGQTRPNTNRPNVSRPGNGTRPSVPNLGGGRPQIPKPGRPGTGRPSAGDLGDFLGMDKPLRPETRPGTIRPGEKRPGVGERPGNRPDNGLAGIANRPGNSNNRPGIANRPGRDRLPGLGRGPELDGRFGNVNIGEINVGNNGVINNRPTWANIDRNRVTNINNRWQNQIGGLRDWPSRYPNRIARWNNWGGSVRNHFHYHYHNWFGANWWTGHPHRWCGWHYGYHFYRHPWSYWWTAPTFGRFASWFAWTAPTTVWSQPVYYDYGTGGNVTYQNNVVYIDGQQVASSDEFAQSAMDLATVDPPVSEEVAQEAEWMPLGVFAVSTSEKEVEPNQVVQLAVNKEGIVSGTLFNEQTDEAVSIQGQVDKQTQRVAFRVGESEKVVVESGLYNLTQQEAPILVHFGTDKVEEWLLVRLEDDSADAAE